jgi:hypothetical protein
LTKLIWVLFGAILTALCVTGVIIHIKRTALAVRSF